MGRTWHRLLLLATTVTIATLTGHRRSSAKEYTVGDSIWSIPPINDFFNNWSRNTSFFVGDSLLFRFETGFYDVVQVSRREYDDCSSDNPFKILLIGPARVLLQEDGVFYYICNFGNYCSLGQKLSVSVSRHV